MGEGPLLEGNTSSTGRQGPCTTLRCIRCPLAGHLSQAQRASPNQHVTFPSTTRRYGILEHLGPRRPSRSRASGRSPRARRGTTLSLGAIVRAQPSEAPSALLLSTCPQASISPGPCAPLLPRPRARQGSSAPPHLGGRLARPPRGDGPVLEETTAFPGRQAPCTAFRRTLWRSAGCLSEAQRASRSQHVTFASTRRTPGV